MINLVDVGLDHPRGGAPLVTGANLAVAGGEVVVIVGAAGVGTSRLVAAALGEAPLACGRIELLGRDVSRLRRASLRLLRRHVGIIPQELCLLEDRSAQLNVVLPLEIDGIPRSVSVLRAAEILETLGLESEAALPVECLPPSARQRVAVARALVRRPEVVIADHPTSAQDAAGADIVCTALAAAAHKGAAVIVFGRDPMLRTIADLYGWRQLALVDGTLHSVEELELHGRSIDGGVVTLGPLPVGDPTIPNVVPFPRAESRVATGPINIRSAGAR